jgi:hypothetical protein
MDDIEIVTRSPEAVYIFAGIGLLILLALLIWGVKNPVVWRLLSVFAVAGGVSLLVWGITSAAMREQNLIASPTSLIGGGAGVMVGGIMLFIISFCGKSRC